MSFEAVQDRWGRRDLTGRVAVVTGASRGVGRGIAEVLGECGATVYVCARTTRQNPAVGDSRWTIETVAEEIDRRGGIGVSVRCDFGSEADVRNLFERVADEQGQLDVLVNNVIGWDAPRDWRSIGQDILERWRAPLWEREIENWDGNFHVGLRSHFLACRFGIPLMLKVNRGLIIFTGEQPNPEPIRDLAMDVRAHATARFVFALARQLLPHGIASLLLYPPFSRTESILENWSTGHPEFSGWRGEDFLAKTKSVYYTGRAVAALAADADVMRKSGLGLDVHEVAERYGFTDET